MRNYLFFFVVLAAMSAVAGTATADRGVGVNIAEVEVGTSLSRGKGYYLPSFAVINTGSEASGYELSIGYLEDQPERRPAQDWFSFQPQYFSLEPAASLAVDVVITVPTDAEPGDYFALVRAQTTSEQASGTRVGLAAATKLSFTVEPTSWLSAQQHRVSRWLDDYAPWTYLLPGLVLLGILASKARKLPFRLRVERK